MEIKTRELNLVVLENAFYDGYDLAMEIINTKVRYFLISPNDLSMCIIAVSKYHPEFTNEQHVEAITNTIGMENIETYMKKLRNLAKFAVNNIII